MLGNIGFPTLILILIVALLLFGPNKLPELGRAFGKTLREFKKGTRDLMDDEQTQEKAEQKKLLKSDDGQERKEETKRLPD